ncbi:MAG TPA: hypothetical protein VFV58_39235 [Blastocatellia bacterium]|jgi:hypothetical protein|nr:hypothetical protein [Blastocatellia bacterium]
MARERAISLSVVQRLGLENLLGEQKGKREELRCWYNVRQKIRINSEEKRKYLRPNGNGGMVFDDVAAEAADTAGLFQASLTDDEIRRLVKLGDSLELACGQLDWLEPLLQVLEAKPAD